MEASELIALVERVAPAATALERITTAVEVGDEAGRAADDAVRHFVDVARRGGHSWSEIGAKLGVSKQAARKRFAAAVISPVEYVGDLELRPRLRACLDAAHREAEADGAAEPGGQHLLLGLFTEGYAANLLDKLGLTVERARAEVRRLFPAPVPPDPDDPLASATAAAHRRGDCYVGTEHVLFVLVHDGGSRAYRVLSHLGMIAAIKKELHCFEPRRESRWKPRRQRAGRCRCSFCGRASDAARLVAGPGVWICRQCIDHAADVLGSEPRQPEPLARVQRDDP